MGIFDEGCMGMYNAIIDDELLNPTGIFKERLSQSALVAKMRTVSDAEAEAVYDWLVAKGVKFDFGKDPATELTLDQVLEQCKMYIAAVRIAREYGCDAIGIQYQQGLKDMAPASDLAEGMLNNADRPPVFAEGTNEELYAGGPVPHFNEVDECAGTDALITNRCWNALGLDPVNHAARCSLGRALQGRRAGRVCVAAADFRRSAGQPLCRRLCGRNQRTPAGDVFSFGRRLAEGRGQAGRDCMEPRVC